MKTTSVTVPFPEGLHSRPAAKLVNLCGKFQAAISLRLGDKVASARSLLGVLLLAASFRSQLEILASGPDEDAAIAAAQAFFQTAG